MSFPSPSLRVPVMGSAPAVPVLDSFLRAEERILHRGWVGLPWAAEPGRVYGSNGGWGPVEAFPTLAGAYWVSNQFATPAVSCELAKAPSAVERDMALWLCMSPDQSGYAVRLRETGGNLYTVTIERWVAGERSTLWTAGGVRILTGDAIEPVVREGIIRVWHRAAETTSVLGEAPDSTFTQGYVGLEAAGDNWRLRNFSVMQWGGPIYAMSYGGLTFGGLDEGETYQFQELPEGLGLPDYLTGDVQRALDQGEYPGLDLSPGRNIIIKQVVQAATPAGLDEARQALAGVLGPGGSTEQPLYLQMPSGLFACMARPRKHSPPLDIKAVLAHANEISSLFHATDPRWYAVPSKTATVGLAEPGGLIPPVTPPVTIEGGTGGLVEAVNAGQFEMRPIFIVTGPCKNPRITNVSLPGAPSIAFEVTLNPGDTLTIDTDWQSVVLVTAGTTAGSSRRSTEMPGSTWFNFPRGVNIVEFSSDDTTHVAGILTVQWADARLGL